METVEKHLVIGRPNGETRNILFTFFDVLLDPSKKTTIKDWRSKYARDEGYDTLDYLRNRGDKGYDNKVPINVDDSATIESVNCSMSNKLKNKKYAKKKMLIVKDSMMADGSITIRYYAPVFGSIGRASRCGSMTQWHKQRRHNIQLDSINSLELGLLGPNSLDVLYSAESAMAHVTPNMFYLSKDVLIIDSKKITFSMHAKEYMRIEILLKTVKCITFFTKPNCIRISIKPGFMQEINDLSTELPETSNFHMLMNSRKLYKDLIFIFTKSPIAEEDVERLKQVFGNDKISFPGNHLEATLIMGHMFVRATLIANMLSNNSHVDWAEVFKQRHVIWLEEHRHNSAIESRHCDSITADENSCYFQGAEQDVNRHISGSYGSELDVYEHNTATGNNAILSSLITERGHHTINTSASMATNVTASWLAANDEMMQRSNLSCEPPNQLSSSSAIKQVLQPLINRQYPNSSSSVAPSLVNSMLSKPQTDQLLWPRSISNRKSPLKPIRDFSGIVSKMVDNANQTDPVSDDDLDDTCDGYVDGYRKEDRMVIDTIYRGPKNFVKNDTFQKKDHLNIDTICQSRPSTVTEIQQPVKAAFSLENIKKLLHGENTKVKIVTKEEFEAMKKNPAILKRKLQFNSSNNVVSPKKKKMEDSSAESLETSSVLIPVQMTNVDTNTDVVADEFNQSNGNIINAENNVDNSITEVIDLSRMIKKTINTSQGFSTPPVRKCRGRPKKIIEEDKSSSPPAKCQKLEVKNSALKISNLENIRGVIEEIKTEPIETSLDVDYSIVSTNGEEQDNAGELQAKTPTARRELQYCPGRNLKNIFDIYNYSPSPEAHVKLNGSDLLCLNHGEYLNDNIINFYLNYLHYEVLKPEQREHTHLFNVFFNTKLQGSCAANCADSPEVRHGRVSKWTKKVDLFDKDYIIVPVNEDKHWFLIIVCFPWMVGMVSYDNLLSRDDANSNNSVIPKNDTKFATVSRFERVAQLKEKYDIEPLPCILLFDSRQGKSRLANIKIIREYLKSEWDIKRAEKDGPLVFDKNTIRGYNPRVPQQRNSIDCGIYLMHYVEMFFKHPLKKYTMDIFEHELQGWFEKEIMMSRRLCIQNLVLKKAEENKNVDIANAKARSSKRSVKPTVKAIESEFI